MKDKKLIQPYIDIFCNPKLHKRKIVKEARDKIIVFYVDAVDYWVNRLHNTWSKWSDIEELKTAGLLGLMKAVDKWDGNRIGIKTGRKAQLSTWIFRGIHHAISSNIRRKTMKKRKHNGVYSYNNFVKNNDGCDTEFLESMPDKKDYIKELSNRDFLFQISKKLKPSDLKLFNYCVLHFDEPLKHCNADFGISIEALRCRKKKLLNKIKVLMKNS